MARGETVMLADDFMTPTKEKHTHYIVGFARISVENRVEDADVAGSGTLVRIGERRGILTAAHVVTNLPKKGDTGLVYTSTADPKPLRVTVKAEHCAFVRLGPGATENEGPDLGFIVLAPPDANNVEAKKSFLNLNRRQADVLAKPLEPEFGIWMIAGFVHEQTREADSLSPHIRTKSFYCLFADLGTPRESSAAVFDYLDFEVPHGPEHDAPESFRGVSGGGVWHALVGRDAAGAVIVKSVVLSGVAFHQSNVVDGKRKLRCHGPRSIYDALISEVEKQP